MVYDMEVNDMDFFSYLLQKPNVLTETDKINTSTNVKSPTGSSRKRKRRSIAGLAKVNLSTSFLLDFISGFLIKSHPYAILVVFLFGQLRF